MGRVLKRFLKQHGAYAAAGVAATARGIGEAAGGEGSEDQMFTIALASLFALGIIGGCADCTLRAEPRRPACKRYARPSLRRLLPMFLQRNDAILSIGDCFSGSLICPLDLSPLPERRTLAVAICAHPRTIASTDWPLPQVACLSAPPSRTCFPSRPNSTRCLPERR